MQPLIQYCHQCQSSHPPGQHKARQPAPRVVNISERRPPVTITRGPGELAAALDLPVNETVAKWKGKAPVQNRTKKPAGTKKPKSKPRAIKPRTAQTENAAPPTEVPKARPPYSIPDKPPEKMTRAELEKLVADVLAEKAHKRELKAKHQATWRAKPKKAKRRGR